VAAGADGNVTVAWVAGSARSWNLQARSVDPDNVPQAIQSPLSCPFSGEEPPVPLLSHHRNDPSRPGDIDVVCLDPGEGRLHSIVLRPGADPLTYAAEAEGERAEAACSSVSAPGDSRLLFYGSRLPEGYPVSGMPLTIRGTTSPPPETLSPADGAKNIGTAVTFTWTCVPDAKSYDFQLSTDGSFTTTPLVSRTGLSEPSSPVAGLRVGTDYYWRVRGRNSAGEGSYSPAASFSTSAAPPAPALSGTTVLAGSIRYPRLTWSAPATISLFRLYRYLCADGRDCFSTARPALIYEGPERAFTDGQIMVGSKLAGGRAFYFVRAVDRGLASAASNTISYSTRSNVVWNDAGEPVTTGLMGNYPNPFNPTTTISYTLASEGYVELKVFNLLGGVVAELSGEVQGAGPHTKEWNASGSPAGVYILELIVRHAGDRRVVRDRTKLLLMK